MSIEQQRDDARERVEATLRRIDSNVAHVSEAARVDLANILSSVARIYECVQATQLSVLKAEAERMRRRRRPTAATVAELVVTIAGHPFNGKCPACMVVPVLDGDGRRLPGRSEVDHHNAANHRSGKHVWLICVECHKRYTREEIPRDDPSFDYFQKYRAATALARQQSQGVLLDMAS
jgi:hypothetical protein